MIFPRLLQLMSKALRWGLVISIWVFCLIAGLRGSWWLHHQLFWKSFDEWTPMSWMFIPCTDQKGSPTILPLNDDGKFKLTFKSLDPPQDWVLNRSAFANEIKSFSSHNNGLYSALRHAEIIDYGNKEDGHHYEVATFNYRGWETRWRYTIKDNKISFSKWYFIRDTAGFILLPLASIFWFPMFFAARWVIRKLLKKQSALSQSA
jgi:hypothetical protein